MDIFIVNNLESTSVELSFVNIFKSAHILVLFRVKYLVWNNVGLFIVNNLKSSDNDTAPTYFSLYYWLVSLFSDVNVAIYFLAPEGWQENQQNTQKSL